MPPLPNPTDVCAKCKQQRRNHWKIQDGIDITYRCMGKAAEVPEFPKPEEQPKPSAT